MNYIVYGKYDFFVEKQISLIIQQHIETVNSFNVVRFDYPKTLMGPILDDAMSLPLFEKKKVIIIKNPVFLYTPKYNEMNDVDPYLNELTKFIEHQSEDVVLIFTFLLDSDGIKKDIFARRTPLVKDLLDKAKIIPVADISDYEWPILIRKIFVNRAINIDEDALKLFIEREGRDLIRVRADVEKLACYGDHITLDVVNNLIDKPFEDNVFDILNAIIGGFPDIALNRINDLYAQNIDPFYLVSVFASQVRFMYQVKYLTSKGKNEQTISAMLDVKNPYRVKLVKEKTAKISAETLLRLLQTLYEIDKGTKGGYLDKKTPLELLCIEPFR